MSNIQSLTVRAKLVLAFTTMIALLFIVTGAAFYSLSNVQAGGKGAEGGHSIASRIALAEQLRTAVSARAIAARDLTLSTLELDRFAAKSAVEAAHKKVGATLATLKEASSTDRNISSKERDGVAEIDRVEERYAPVALKVVGLALSDKKDEATVAINTECRPLLAALNKATDDFVATASSDAEQEAAAATAAIARGKVTTIAISGVALLAALVLAKWITAGLLRTLGAEPAALKAATERVASGDLGSVEGAAKAPAGSVLKALGEMQASLAKVVSEVRQSSDSIATGSSQIATGNADLSQRTEQQASNLQNTAASMEELTSTVKNNADSAQQANQLASTASSAAAQGGQVVSKVITTMQEITASSKKISDIIGVIDGIAFQTNILALNAAVEAARAGEQGRGFAVVAGEVRSLAQRSADAAREIKSLIGASVEKVESGAKIVDDAGRTMDDIVTQVQRVSDLIGEINASTQEQSKGIGQVGDAVGHLDQITQQNAALVEESAAAAESLRIQAAQLSDTVAAFKLEATAAARPAVVKVAKPRPAAVVKPAPAQPRLAAAAP
ncbi:MAG: methyl-accepting chemotaxis protein, partial [Burkholderiaceae bacterium]